MLLLSLRQSGEAGWHTGPVVRAAADSCTSWPIELLQGGVLAATPHGPSQPAWPGKTTVFAVSGGLPRHGARLSDGASNKLLSLETVPRL